MSIKRHSITAALVIFGGGSIAAHAQQARPALEQVQAACRPDVERLCGGTRGRATIGCMQENQDSLSETCVQALQAAGEARRGG